MNSCRKIWGFQPRHCHWSRWPSDQWGRSRCHVISGRCGGSPPKYCGELGGGRSLMLMVKLLKHIKYIVQARQCKTHEWLNVEWQDVFTQSRTETAETAETATVLIPTVRSPVMSFRVHTAKVPSSKVLANDDERRCIQKEERRLQRRHP